MGLDGFAKVLAAGGVGVQALLYASNNADALLRPPGAQDEDDFSARCIRCGKCVEACPYRAIHVVNDFTSISSGTPYLDVRATACRMCEDFPCVKACPSGALRECEAREDVHMGTAFIVEDTCIAFDGMRCEVCYRTCPLIDQAITIDYQQREGDSIHALFIPVIHQDVCTGCGLCVERCVTDDPAIKVVRDLK